MATSDFEVCPSCDAPLPHEHAPRPSSSVIPVTPAHLLSACSRTMSCRDRDCAEAVKVNPATGRAFITMGHAGFNSTTNNRSGYSTPGGAWRAMVRLLEKVRS